MNPVNNASLIRRDLMVRLAKLTFDGDLLHRIDRIPVEMIPKRKQPLRCCVHKDRAVIRYRIMALLGFSIEEEQDELTPLADYARAALERDTPDGPVLTVLDEACSSCVESRYFVTNACRGCMARPCTLNCPKDAISVINGRAVIDREKCVNCGICLKVCPYHAIVRMPIPCEEACPVGAIDKDQNGIERIDHEKCIQCGQCQQACPFGAVMEKSSLINIANAIVHGEQMAAIVAPAVVGQFDPDPEKLYSALKTLGFSVIIEAAAGADKTLEKESAEWKEIRERENPLMTTSCCPAWTAAAIKHIPEISGAVSHTPSPMIEAAAVAKAGYPDHRRIFIGPCTAKRMEAAGDPNIDAVMTFEELGALLVAKDIDVSGCSPCAPDIAGSVRGRGFPVSGGVAEGLSALLKDDPLYKQVRVDGLNRKNINLLKAYAKGKCPGTFLEVMACEGGCISGPGSVCPQNLAKKSLSQFLEKSS